MPYRTDDLTPLFSPRDEGGTMLYAQGKLLAFNPATLENEVAFRGTVARNLNVSAAAVDAAVWQPGDLLELRGHAPRRGPSVWWIGSRILTPGPGAAAQLTAALTAINAANIVSATAVGTETLDTPGGIRELPGGPVLTVDIPASGKVIVHLSAAITSVSTAASPDFTLNGGRMGVALSGANTVVVSNDRSVAVSLQTLSFETDSPFPGNTVTNEIANRSGATFVMEGLLPGLTTFTAMYTRLFDDTSVGFADRTIVVIRT